MTHTSKEKKKSASFIFRAHRDGLPDFSGYLVYSYTSHARLAADRDSYTDLTQRANDTELRRRFESRLGTTTEEPEEDCLFPRRRAAFGRGRSQDKDCDTLF
eukprot:TRINITY_DN8929_c0_g1_i1.p1 TRINITY_DN8929_c0_g1~~TRINITY_DN8929_c0_g1_i1.p1  ORF type:complete len:102 (-),score=24.29 TRINITY_DN8929_c0_g1_i1:223-528(-)